MARCKTLSVKHPRAKELEGLPSFSSTGNITGMKNKYYGKNALLVRCGSYIYNVTHDAPELYDLAH